MWLMSVDGNVDLRASLFDWRSGCGLFVRSLTPFWRLFYSICKILASLFALLDISGFLLAANGSYWPVFKTIMASMHQIRARFGCVGSAASLTAGRKGCSLARTARNSPLASVLVARMAALSLALIPSWCCWSRYLYSRWTLIARTRCNLGPWAAMSLGGVEGPRSIFEGEWMRFAPELLVPECGAPGWVCCPAVPLDWPRPSR